MNAPSRPPEQSGPGTVRLAKPNLSAELAARAAERRAPPPDADVSTCAGPNTGTIDPNLVAPGAAVDQTWQYGVGYLDGHRNGVLQAIFLGFLAGAAVTGIAFQLGLTAGPL